jgi:soluble lytic murein transglycosylase
LNFDKLVAKYPSSPLASRGRWESAWTRFTRKDYAGAEEKLRQLVPNPAQREKSLYWLGRVLELRGEKEKAAQTYNTLVKEYPFGFYALYYRKAHGMKCDSLPSLRQVNPSAIPIPAGYEKVKALMAFGMTKEATNELGSIRRKGIGETATLNLARMYWEISDYRSALSLFNGAGSENPLAWSFAYPIAFWKEVSEVAEKEKVPISLAYSIIRAESSFSPAARSPVGAVGLMQVMPATAKAIGTVAASDLTAPHINVKLGLHHLKNLLRKYDGNVVLAVAAYNSGATPVDRWRKRFPTLKGIEFIESITYGETRDYVKKVLAAMEIYRELYEIREATPATGPEINTASSTNMTSDSKTLSKN